MAESSRGKNMTHLNDSEKKVKNTVPDQGDPSSQIGIGGLKLKLFRIKVTSVTRPILNNIILKG